MANHKANQAALAVLRELVNIRDDFRARMGKSEPINYNGWGVGTTERKPLAPRAAVHEALHRRNPTRWARLQKDYAWLEREMIRMNLTPEDARYLL